MPDVVTVSLLDQEAAVREGLDTSRASTRSEFFRKSLLGGGAFLGGGVLIAGLPSIATAQEPSAEQDVEILQFALLLEQLEAAFYTEAVAGGALSGEVLEFATVVRDHETAHVEFLTSALGDAASPPPAFDFQGTTGAVETFLATSIVLEDTGVAAYNGQGPRLRRRTLAAAASIVSVEARHAAWVRHIVSAPDYDAGRRSYPAPARFDPALSAEEVTEAVRATGFVPGL